MVITPTKAETPTRAKNHRWYFYYCKKTKIVKLTVELSGGNSAKLPEILGFPPNLKSSEQ